MYISVYGISQNGNTLAPKAAKNALKVILVRFLISALYQLYTCLIFVLYLSYLCVLSVLYNLFLRVSSTPSLGALPCSWGFLRVSYNPQGFSLAFLRVYCEMFLGVSLWSLLRVCCYLSWGFPPKRSWGFPLNFSWGFPKWFLRVSSQNPHGVKIFFHAAFLWGLSAHSWWFLAFIALASSSCFGKKTTARSIPVWSPTTVLTAPSQA